LKQAAAPKNPLSPTALWDVLGVPSEYLDYREVFSEAKATSLPPHHPYDCAIDLHPDTSPPEGHLYSLSTPERESMDKYLHSLATGIIRPSASPAGMGFFFVDKMDKRPCINYRGPNYITVKNHYPLLLCPPPLLFSKRW